jgi:hypothetical protein
MFTKKWLVDATERVVSTAAEALLAVLTTPAVHWGQKLQITGIAALASFLKNLVAAGTGGDPNGSLVPSLKTSIKKGS